LLAALALALAPVMSTFMLGYVMHALVVNVLLRNVGSIKSLIVNGLTALLALLMLQLLWTCT
jgi:hypothetical protein